MKALRYIFTGLLVLTLASCKSSKATDAQIAALDAIVAKQEFRIESHTAYPQTTYATQQVVDAGWIAPGNNSNSIKLLDNPNFLMVSGDSISSHLPYYGERQQITSYGGGDDAIAFEGVIENYKTVKHKDNSYTISFNARSHSERFNVMLKLRPNNSSYIALTGGKRFPIKYSGNLKPVAAVK